ncbi:DUF4870 domain-containing protein [Shewanella maritima]|uniref:DUF4870 domain-containing protein n=1 Tax=Shewanella maritima TaxID=2520507 RepID=UPI003735A1C4
MSEFSSELSQDTKNIGVLVHGMSLVGYLIPLGSIFGPLIVWLMKKDESDFIDQCGKNCLNYKISLLIYVIISSLLALVLVGFVFLAILGIIDIILTILAMVKASDGIAYKYPLTIKFIK